MTATTTVSPRTRSRASNSHDVLPGLDGRSAEGRRFRDLVNLFIADLGGPDNISVVKLSLIRRLAAATLQSELLEARMANGERVTVSELCSLSSTSIRLAAKLGLDKIKAPPEDFQAMLRRKAASFNPNAPAAVEEVAS